MVRPVDQVRGGVDGQAGEELEGRVDEIEFGSVVDYGGVGREARDDGVDGAVDGFCGGGGGASGVHVGGCGDGCEARVLRRRDHVCGSGLREGYIGRRRWYGGGSGSGMGCWDAGTAKLRMLDAGTAQYSIPAWFGSTATRIDTRYVKFGFHFHCLQVSKEGRRALEKA